MVIKYFYEQYDIYDNRKHVRKWSILVTKANATQSDFALSYHLVRGLYFLAAIFAATIVIQWSGYEISRKLL